MFPPGKSGHEIWGFDIFRFPGSLHQDPGKCLYISKDFSGTDISYTDIKSAFALRYCKLKFFLPSRNYFSQNSQNCFRRNAVRSNFFSLFVKTMDCQNNITKC